MPVNGKTASKRRRFAMSVRAAPGPSVGPTTKAVALIIGVASWTVKIAAELFHSPMKGGLRGGACLAPKQRAVRLHKCREAIGDAADLRTVPFLVMRNQPLLGFEVAD